MKNLAQTIKVITYKTTFVNDSYFIYKDDIEIGRLFKSQWVGSETEGNIEEFQLKFVSDGLINPVVSILDEAKGGMIIGSISVKKFRNFSPQAILTTVNDNQYCWVPNGLFIYTWRWEKLISKEEIISSKEIFSLNQKSGNIDIKETGEDEDLLVLSGIYLRDVVKNEAILNPIIILLIIALILVRLLK